MEFEYAVMSVTDTYPHRTIMTRDQAERFVWEAEQDGIRPGHFYVVCRQVTPWTQF